VRRGEPVVAIASGTLPFPITAEALGQCSHNRDVARPKLLRQVRNEEFIGRVRAGAVTGDREHQPCSLQFSNRSPPASAARKFELVPITPASTGSWPPLSKREKEFVSNDLETQVRVSGPASKKAIQVLAASCCKEKLDRHPFRSSDGPYVGRHGSRPGIHRLSYCFINQIEPRCRENFPDAPECTLVCGLPSQVALPFRHLV